MPRKGQKVHLDFFMNTIRTEKEGHKGLKRRGMLKTWIWGEDPADKMERTRFIVLLEGKIITIKQEGESERKYGHYFNTGEDQKVKMPSI